jgi:hypothetical protein
MDARIGAAPCIKTGSFLEFIAINIAWPLALIRFGMGLLTEQPFEALQGLVFYFLVVFYALVRLSQVSRSD